MIRENAGFKIIKSIRTDDRTEFVLGEKETKFGTEYVTWFCKNEKNYNHGHYTNSLYDAFADLYYRAKNELTWYYNYYMDLLDIETEETKK